MAEFASKGVAGTGLGLGIAGTALGLMGTHVGNLFGNNYNGNCSENCLVNRYDLGQSEKIARLETEVALRDANLFTDQKIADVFERLNIRITAMDKEQAVVNAKVDSGLGILGSQVASINNTIADLTKTVIPNSSICPGWGESKVCIIPCDPQPLNKK